MLVQNGNKQASPKKNTIFQRQAVVTDKHCRFKLLKIFLLYEK